MEPSIKKYGTEFCFYKFSYYQKCKFYPSQDICRWKLSLLNSASLIVIGDESLSTTLRILDCTELFPNAKFYAYHPYLDDAEKRSLFESDNTPFTYALSESSAPRFGDNDRQSCVRKEAIFMAHIKEWASFICILALSTVIRGKICSYYPIIGLPAIKQLMNGEIYPRLTCEYDDVFHVLWSRDSNFDNTDGKHMSRTTLFRFCHSACGSCSNKDK